MMQGTTQASTVSAVVANGISTTVRNQKAPMYTMYNYSHHMQHVTLS